MKGQKTLFNYLVLVYFLPLSLSAQTSREIYDQAIDRVNFATMQYVLSDDKQKPAAMKLSSELPALSYDIDSLHAKITQIYNSPNSKTQELSNKINLFKEKFNGRKPVGEQLDQVIVFVTKDRKNKAYLVPLKKQLIDIKNKAIELAEENGQFVNVAALQANVSQPNVTQQAAFPDFLSIMVFVLGIISIVNLWLYYQLKQKKSRFSGEKDDYYKTVRQSIDFEIYPRLEKNNENLEKKIENLRQEILSLLKETHTIAREPTPAIPAVQKIQTEQNSTETRSVKIQSQITNHVEEPKTVNFQIAKPATSEPAKQPKKYADYPKENGFAISQLQDISDRRSIYEIIIPANSDQAVFTIVDNKELHEYAIQNRERLLKEACDFEISSSQHTRIEVLKPGKLLKNGNSWQIVEKAKIKFV